MTDPWDHFARQVEKAEAVCHEFGLRDPAFGPLQYDWGEIERQAATLLERKRGSYRTRARDVMPESFVSYWCARLLACYVVARQPVPSVVLRLIADQLGVPGYAQAGKRAPLKQEHARELVENHPTMSNAEIARRVGVSPATMTRWFPDRRNRCIQTNS